MAFGRTTNGELAAKLDALIEKSNERHEENTKRLDSLLAKADLTNGRLTGAEKDIIRIAGRIEALEDKPSSRGQTLRISLASGGGTLALWEIIKHWFIK